MREKYEMLKITDLRAIVKGLGVKGYSSMGKEQLIDILVEKEKEDSAAKEAAVKSEAPKKAAPKKDAQRGNAQGQSDRGAAGEKASEKNADKGAEKSAEAESAEAIRESGVKEVGGVLEVMSDGFGFIRSDNFLPGNNDIYVVGLLDVIIRTEIKTFELVILVSLGTRDKDMRIRVLPYLRAY